MSKRTSARGPFVPTHRLVEDHSETLHLPAGTLLRQVTPFADEFPEFLDGNDWENGCRTTWIFHRSAVEPLPGCEEILSRMREAICR